MSETDKTRLQQDALRRAKGLPTESSRRASASMLRYLGVNLYHERKRGAEEDKRGDEHQEPSDD